MKTNKRGISLIVLVITIIVIIILAAAVILTLNNNNPIQNSKQATFDNDVSEVTSAINIYIANFMAKNPVHDGPFDTSKDNWVKIGITPGDDDNLPAAPSNVGGETTYGTYINWTDLGLSKPASIKLIEFNPKNGQVRVIPSQTGVTGSTKSSGGNYTVEDDAF